MGPLMQIGNITIEPWNRHNAIYRIIALALVALWLGWGVTIFIEGRKINARFQAWQEEQQLKEERVRRAAVYRQSLEEQQRPQSRVRNAVDGVKK